MEGAGSDEGVNDSVALNPNSQEVLRETPGATMRLIFKLTLYSGGKDLATLSYTYNKPTGCI